MYKSKGIYGIRNIHNGKVYVGQTLLSFGDRKDHHFSMLRHGKHSNKKLQADWDIYGEISFEIICLEVVSEEQDLNKKEEQYIRHFMSDGLSYNISIHANKPWWYGKHLPQEIKAKIGKANKKLMTGKKASIATRKKMSESQKARYAKWTDKDRKAHGQLVSEKSRGYSWSDKSKENFAKLQETKPNGAKYDISTVRKIRTMHEDQGMTYSEISESLSIPRGTVYNIATYRRWPNA